MINNPLIPLEYVRWVTQETDAFLELPHSTQALYFHLVMGADEDAINDAPLATVRATKCTKEDLQRLFDGGYIEPNGLSSIFVLPNCGRDE